MIAPIVPYGIKGAIWYQGESNASRGVPVPQAAAGDDQDVARRAGGSGEFPFLIVQLANFTPPPAEPGDSDWAELREAQAMTAKQPNNGLAVTIDIGDAADIHPRNKEDVGKRLAFVALAKTYGKADVVYVRPGLRVDGGRGRQGSRSSSSTRRRAGRRRTAAALKGFAVAGEDKKWHWADATIDGETVVVRSDKVAKPVAVRYAWAQQPADEPLQQGRPAGGPVPDGRLEGRDRRRAVTSRQFPETQRPPALPSCRAGGLLVWPGRQPAMPNADYPVAYIPSIPSYPILIRRSLHILTFLQFYSWQKNARGGARAHKGSQLLRIPSRLL